MSTSGEPAENMELTQKSENEYDRESPAIQ